MSRWRGRESFRSGCLCGRVGLCLRFPALYVSKVNFPSQSASQLSNRRRTGGRRAIKGEETYARSNSHTPTNQHPRLRIPRRHHAELIRLGEFDQCLYFLLERDVLLGVFGLIWVDGGGAGTGDVCAWVGHFGC